jgi:putative lipoic acid-binding regulatory protein
LGNFFDGRKPDITYPCRWSYRIIGWDELRLRAVVAELVGSDEHTLLLARESSSGKYRTLQLELTVRDEQHRTWVFERLARHPDVRFVL